MILPLTTIKDKQIYYKNLKFINTYAHINQIW